jgi:hypothetical protein
LKLKSIFEKESIRCGIENRWYDKTGVVTKLKVNSTNQSLKVFDFLYKNATIYLERKYNTFLDMLSYIDKQSKRKCLYCDKSVFGNNVCHDHLDYHKLKSDENYTRSKKIDIEVLTKMVRECKTQRYIAKYFGVSPSAICKIIRKRNLLGQVQAS